MRSVEQALHILQDDLLSGPQLDSVRIDAGVRGVEVCGETQETDLDSVLACLHDSELDPHLVIECTAVPHVVWSVQPPTWLLMLNTKPIF